MKYTTSIIIAIAGISNAMPHPQFNLPAFSMPSFSIPTGLPGSGSGSGFDWSSLAGGGGKVPSLPATTGGGSGFGSGFDWSSLIGGGGSSPGGGLGGGLVGSTPIANPTQSGAVAVPIQTGIVAVPTQTGSNTGGANTIGSNCTPQAAGSGSTENGITDKNCCTDMTVIFARGTGEGGNVGIVSGPPMFKALRSKLGNERVTVQGVDYPASAGGNANLGADGGKKMADMVATALSQCPNTKIIVSGYSQGGMVVHNAFSNGLTASKVSGAVLFGDPLKRSPVGDMPTEKVKQFCGSSDTICGGGGDGGATGGHISYGSSADAAATFAIQAAGLA